MRPPSRGLASIWQVTVETPGSYGSPNAGSTKTRTAPRLPLALGAARVNSLLEHGRLVAASANRLSELSSV